MLHASRVTKRASLLPLIFAVTTLGISSVITQISVTRELLTIFHGNELVLGIILSAWLMLTGAGAFLGRFQRWKIQTLVVSLVLVSLLPFAHLLLLRFGRYTVSIPGAVAELRVLLVYVPVLLAPYCLVSGYLLALACSLLSGGERRLDVGKVYLIDNIGDILGGLIFSFVLVYLMDTFDSLYLPGVLNLMAAAVVCVRYRYRMAAAFILLLLLVFPVMHLSGLEGHSLKRLYPSQNIVHRKESPYGRIVVTRDAEQFNFFENGVPFHSSGDRLNAEETVHFALPHLPGKELSVLLISGGITGTLEEILKYPVHMVDYVELDPEIIRAGRRFLGALPSDRVTVHTTDGRKFLEDSRKKYHAIIVDLPPPSNIQLNRFYSVEFFSLARQRLVPGGVVTFSLPGAENYINRELAGLYSLMAATAEQVFDTVRAYPAGKAVFVASDRGLGYGIAGLLAQKNIQTRYVNTYYLHGILTRDRIHHLNSHCVPGESINRDLRPAAFRTQLKYWLSFFQININWMLVLFAVAGMVFLLAYRPVEAALWSTGFTSVSLEVLILLLFQIHAGYIYHTYGIVITLFMAGLAAGSFLANTVIARGAAGQARRRSLLAGCELLLIGYIMTAGGIVTWTGLWKNDFLLYLLVLGASVITGAEFPAANLACGQKPGNAASRLYAADFLGAGIGSLLCAILLVPAWGVKITIWVLLIIKAVSFVKLTMWSKE